MLHQLRSLITAARLGDTRAAAQLLAKDPQLLHSRQAFHVLTTAVMARHLPMVQLLLDHGADVNASPFYGPKSAHTDLERPLHWAVAVAPLEIIHLLLDRGADVEGCVTWYTPLLLAARAGRPDVVQLLRARGAREHFLVQVALGQLKPVKKALVDNPALANQQDEYGTPPLHIAAELQITPMVKLLLSHHADIALSDKHKETVLHKLAIRLFDETLDHWGPRPPDELHKFSESSQLTVAKLLLQAGADVNARNWRGLTPLHRAVRANRIGYVRFLIEHGADINAADVAGDTPLRRAVTDVHRLEVAQLLINAGANIHARTKKSRSVLSLARNPKMKSLLLTAAATADRPKKQKRTPLRNRQRIEL